MTQDPSSVQEYLDRLKDELAGSDPALIQDALYDAEGFLREAMTTTGFAEAIQKFGTPREVAEAYRATDARVAAALAQPEPVSLGSTIAQRVFGVFLDPKAYGSLLFMLLSLATGVLYFTWAVTGIALSLGLSILIFGLPFLFLFLASVRVFALVEGRLIEALTGLRMPRRPSIPLRGGTFLQKLGKRLSEGRTWSTLCYMILKLPLGILSFVVAVTMLAISLALLVAPFAELFGETDFVFLGGLIDLGAWTYPLCWIAGALDLIATMHVARATGRLYGLIAKEMLVSA